MGAVSTAPVLLRFSTFDIALQGILWYNKGDSNDVVASRSGEGFDTFENRNCLEGL